jgi:signal transduction histidine kinase
MFLRLMSRADHALDNYITSIQGHLSVLGEELPTDLQRWQVSRDAIGEAAAQMKRHVQRLRLIRMGLDETTLRVAPVNLARLIEHILIELEPAATESDVTLRMEVQGLTEPVPGDPQVFEEIFTTLLDNAIKHNPPGTEVVAELARRDGMALARVSDTGKGMDDGQVARVFDAGARDASAGSARGTGMGLYIAKVLTELHGGSIDVESQPE